MTDAVVSQLELMAHRTATSIKGILPEVTRERYAMWLNAMYHYTKRAAERLDYGAQMSEDSALTALLNELREEEAEHYKLAEADLRSLGYRPGAEVPKEVQAYDTFWFSISKGEQFGFAGALYALEAVPPLFSSEIPAHIARLAVAPSDVRFLLEHLGGDVKHSALCRELCQKNSGDPDAAGVILRAATEASRHWLEMLGAPLQGRAPTPVPQ